MPAFIDPEAREVVALPECHCPGTPHDHDTVTIKAQYGYGDLLELSRVHTMAGRIDPMAERAKLLEIGIVEWSFVDQQSQPVPVTRSMILLLSQKVVGPITEAIDAAYAASTPPLPNASGARSQPWSQASSGAAKKKPSRRR